MHLVCTLLIPKKNTAFTRTCSRKVLANFCLQKSFFRGPCLFRVGFLHVRFMGHTPSMAGTFRKKFRKNSGKTPETLSERFLEFPSRVRLGCPKPYNSRAFEASRAFPEFSPPQYGWGRLFFQNWFWRGPLRAGHGIPGSTGGISEFRNSRM